MIGSVKSNMGHCESAAGVAGLTKVLLQMQHQQIVPSLHSRELNPHIDFTQTPFVVNQELRKWEQPVIEGREHPRLAGISSFGAGGSNAHMIVEEYQAAVQPGMDFVPVAILLSARTGEQLKQKAGELLDFVRLRVKTVDLGAMAYTLQVGREAMEERAGFLVSSIEQLVEKLEAYGTGEWNIQNFYQGQVKRGEDGLSSFRNDVDLQQTIDKWIAGRKLSKLLELWTKGLEVDWSKLYGKAKPQRMSLPGYPFARERYWVEIPAGKQMAAAVLHPLLHRNTSDLNEQRYTSTFTGEEFFLADHKARANGLAGEKVLPEAAYLEMVRAAIEESLPAQREASVLELRNVEWAQPVAVNESKPVRIALWAENNGEISYEIYSQEIEQEIVHCQGRAVWIQQPASTVIDLAQLKGEMEQGHMEPESVEAARGRMGLVDGDSSRVITAIYQKNNQVLAQLQLPDNMADKAEIYVLHPSLMDGAVQAAAGLIDGLSGVSTGPRLLATVDSLCILSPCSREMFAWARYVQDDHVDKTAKLNIDLCSEQGNVCVRMRGVSWNLARRKIEEPSALTKRVNVQPAASDVLPAIMATLKTLLANELQMRESDIAENIQFIDLGLDSITGVTWVRKINEKYRASIEAIKLYSYPTLTQLSRYVKEESEKHGTLPKQDAAVVQAHQWSKKMVRRILMRQS